MSNEFLAKLSEALDAETTLTIETNLDEIEGWDSLGILSVIGLIETYRNDIELQSIYDSKTVGDLMNLALNE